MKMKMRSSRMTMKTNRHQLLKHQLPHPMRTCLTGRAARRKGVPRKWYWVEEREDGQRCVPISNDGSLLDLAHNRQRQITRRRRPKSKMGKAIQRLLEMI
jgi:hypothetical protein